MQVLSIAGERIASLAAPFEIRLDHGPLSAAGLFAITGETGAGKSSLLDAMCLALYGNCPRLSGEGTRETVADIGGQDLTSGDPRTVLRRGAARAVARVEFRGVDGQAYAAEWMVRRARDRADGRLQAVERSLTRLADGQVLATQATQVQDRVTALTGLTWDEFRRTVLLAQGDFDAFLVARTTERAAILEKVTGTGLYRDISRRAHDRHGQARAEVDRLEVRRAEHRLLTPEERQALADEAAALRVAQAADEAALKQVAADLAAHAALAEAQAALARAVARQGAAAASLDALAEDRVWLAERDRARGVAGELREQAEAARAQAAAVAAQAAAAEAQAAQSAVVKAAAGLAAARKDAHDRAEAAFKGFATDWSRATALDSGIATARDEVVRAAEDLTAAADRTAEARQAQADLAARVAALRQAIADGEAQVAAVPGHAVLLADWPVLDDRLQDRIARATDLAAWLAEQATLTARTATGRAARDANQTAIGTATRATADAHAAQAAVAGERERLVQANPADALARQGQVAADLRDLRAAGQDARAARDALAACDARLAEARAALAAAGEAEVAAAARATLAATRVEALRRPLASADAATSREAAHLRQHLRDGAPCPVCGSPDHPVMADSALAALARDLRTQFEAAETERDAALSDERAAAHAAGTASRTIAADSAARPGLEARRTQVLAVRAAAQGALQAALRADPATAAIADLLPEDADAPDERYDPSVAALADRRRALTADLDRLAALDRVHGDAARVIEVQARAIADRQADLRAIADHIAGDEVRLAALAAAIAAARTEIARTDVRLAPMLAGLGETADRFGAGAGDRLTRLRETASVLSAAQRRIADRRAELANLGPAVAQAEADPTAAAGVETAARDRQGARAAALRVLEDEREGLLGGEATEAHRTRHNDARIAAQAALQDAERALADARAVLAGREAALAAAVEGGDRATDRAARADAALAGACAAAGLDLSRVVALHAAPEAEVAARQARLAAAEAEQAQADGALAERAQALQALTDRGMPDTPPDVLAARQTALDAAIGARGEQMGRLAERQWADTEARARLQDLERAIDTARGTAETWAAVNDAIGSASGDRFAQIAQAVTLALLVDRANLHLHDLKPRYRLRVADTDLALLVADLDMAGEVRTTRSLSGGERFLVSLALALGLSSMGSRGALAGTLFIDEGFGSLDADSLDLAIDALERLQAQGRTVGVISHVQAMKDRIPVQVEVKRIGGGASVVRLKGV